jgi:hypothetical protein
MSKVEPFKSWHPLALCAYIDVKWGVLSFFYKNNLIFEGGLVQREDGDWHLKCSKQNESSVYVFC